MTKEIAELQAQLASCQEIASARAKEILRLKAEVGKYKERISYLEEKVGRREVDHVTNLWTRGVFFEQVNPAFEQAKKDDRAVFVVFGDLDDLKPTNNLLGHHVGDLLLKAYATALLRVTALRPRECFACRWGGDEFVLLIIASSRSERQARRLEKFVWQLRKMLKDDFLSQVAVLQNQYPRLRTAVSLGISSLAKYNNIDELIQIASEKMKKDKQEQKQSKTIRRRS